ncbi:MAG TPA: CoA pyrophosphatase [Spirochaetia bacterium]|nr:CoA pyrophosphatase [Spirochaetia bacterium]
MREGDLKRLVRRLPETPGFHRGKRPREFVVFVPLVLVEGEFHLLFEKRARGIRQEQEICFPGGGVEKGVDGNVEEAAIRETEEELGIDRSRITLLGRLDGIITNWGGVIDVVVGTIASDAVESATPNPEEVERTLLVPVSFFESTPPEEYSLRVEIQPHYTDEAGVLHTLFPTRELGLPERYWKPWTGHPHEIFVYRYDGETIWGITAELTRRIVSLLE